MTAFISLLTIGVVLFILLSLSKKKEAEKPASSQSSQPETYSSIYSGEPSDFDGEGSSLIRKFSGKDDRESGRANEFASHRASIHDSFTEIEFDYLNASGVKSHRTVEVWAVDDEYFEGHCLKAHSTRTFLIGRIRGKVLVHETGELLTARQWATLARADAQNTGIVDIGRDDRDDDSYQHVERYATSSTEILFTGFGKAQRAELESIAKDSGMLVRKSVTKGLSYLCTGPNAGPAKLSEAIDAGASLIDQGEFLALANHPPR